ncbi:MAG: repeat protein [Verrucomicrobiales bacterium]|nr:repeat protein [Verrucomicrobiales bacterium]
MKRRARILVAIGLLALLSGVAYRVWHPREPSWQGKPLSRWVAGFEAPATEQSYKDSAVALRQIGTNALPMLMRMFQVEDSPAKQKLMEVVPRQWWTRAGITPASVDHHRALFALDALGPMAAPAVPELIGLLTVTNVEIQCYAAHALGSIGAEEQVIVPALTNALGDPNYAFRITIEESLARVHKLPEVAVPALIAHLGSIDISEIKAVCLALSKFGPKARAAVPALQELAQDKDSMRSEAAAEAIKHIMPEAPTGINQQ